MFHGFMKIGIEENSLTAIIAAEEVKECTWIMSGFSILIIFSSSNLISEYFFLL